MTEYERLYSDWIDLQYSIISVASIVQNERVTVNEDEMLEWLNQVDSLKHRLDQLKYRTLVAVSKNQPTI